MRAVWHALHGRSVIQGGTVVAHAEFTTLGGVYVGRDGLLMNSHVTGPKDAPAVFVNARDGPNLRVNGCFINVRRPLP